MKQATFSVPPLTSPTSMNNTSTNTNAVSKKTSSSKPIKKVDNIYYLE